MNNGQVWMLGQSDPRFRPFPGFYSRNLYNYFLTLNVLALEPLGRHYHRDSSLVAQHGGIELPRDMAERATQIISGGAIRLPYGCNIVVAKRAFHKYNLARIVWGQFDLRNRRGQSLCYGHKVLPFIACPKTLVPAHKLLGCLPLLGKATVCVSWCRPFAGPTSRHFVYNEIRNEWLRRRLLQGYCRSNVGPSYFLGGLLKGS